MRNGLRVLAPIVASIPLFFLFAGGAAAAPQGPVVYDDFAAPYTLADYAAKWSNIYGLGDMAVAPGDTRSFADGSFAIADAPFRTGADFSVFDHLKYIAISNSAFPVPQLGSLQFESDIKSDTPGAVGGRVVHGTYGPPFSYPGGPPWSAAALEAQQAGAVMNMINFETGQLFDWFIAGNTAFDLVERLPSAVTGSVSPDWVGPSLMYTQIVSEVPVTPGVYHHVAIRYTRDVAGDNVKFYLDGKLVDTVANVGIPLDRRGTGQHWTGIYPSLGPGEQLRPYLNSFVIGHGTFSLLDAFPFQWGWTPDPTYGPVPPCVADFASFASACNASVSIPLSERTFGQGVNAHFDNFTVTTKGD